MTTSLDERFIQPQGWEWQERFVIRSGQYVRMGWVTPPSPRAVVTIFPGLSEYIEKYFEVARDLVARGFAVACIDWRGQGLSWRQDDPTKRYHDDFISDVEDAHAFLKFLPVPPSLPRVMLAHSMGGHIGLRVLYDMPQSFRCAVMTAPLFGLNAPEWLAASIVRPLFAAGLGDSYIPTHGPWSRGQLETNLNLLSSDEDRKAMQVYWMENHPGLRMGGLTVGWLRAALMSMRIVRDPAYLQAVKVPCLLVQGGREMVVSNQAIDQVARNLPNAEKLHIGGALHEVMMEKDDYRNHFWQAFDTFVAKHLEAR